MLRLFVIMAGLLWASLLLISWSAPGEPVLPDLQPQVGIHLNQQ